MIIFILLFFLPLIFITLLLSDRIIGIYPILKAFLWWGFLIVSPIEILSPFKLLHAEIIVLYWLIVNFLLLVISIRKHSFRHRIVIQWQQYIPFLIILLITFFVGLFYAPSNWDSMTYHLSRVFFWIQQASIDHYPTNNLRQLTYNPFAEYGLLHILMLTGSDRFAFMMQWISQLAVFIGMSGIIWNLTKNRKAIWLSLLLISTLPIGLLESYSTQNDYVVAMWLTIGTYIIFKIIRNKILTNSDSIYLGLAVGLGFLTKGTAYYMFAPLGVIFICYFFRKLYIPNILIILSTILLLNMNFWWRNYNMFSFPIDQSIPVTNSVLGIRPLISNVLRNLVTQYQLPDNRINEIIYLTTLKIHKLMRFDPNDSRTTYPNVTFSTQPFLVHQDATGDVLFVSLLLFSIVIFFKYYPQKIIYRIYAMVVLANFLLFNIVLMWQPWHSRLLLPIFIISVPLVVYGLLTPPFLRLKIISIFLTIVLFLEACYWITFNVSSPLLGEYSIFTTDRSDQYFASRPSISGDYFAIINYINQSSCQTIGLSLGDDDYEYPLVKILSSLKNSYMFEHVGVYNNSTAGQIKARLPCAIVVPDNKILNLEDYTKHTFGTYAVYSE